MGVVDWLRTGPSKVHLVMSVSLLGAFIHVFFTQIAGKYPRWIIWTYDAFKRSFGINHKFRIYLKDGCVLDFVQHFCFLYFLKFVFGQVIPLRQSGGFGCFKHEWVNPFNAEATFVQSTKKQRILKTI